RTYAAPLQLDLEACDVAEVWREAWDQLALRREGRDARLSEKLGDAPRDCAVDRFRLRQVFRNIPDNALAACADPGRMAVGCVELARKGQPARGIWVEDNGPGLTEEQRRKIFEPFYTTKTKGTGLGMAIAKKLVELHGGSLEVGENLDPGAAILI